MLRINRLLLSKFHHADRAFRAAMQMASALPLAWLIGRSWLARQSAVADREPVPRPIGFGVTLLYAPRHALGGDAACESVLIVCEWTPFGLGLFLGVHAAASRMTSWYS